jgi:hypothetical protein
MNEGARSKTLQHVIEHPPLRDATECRNLIARIQERADSQAWPGKAGASARVVLQALIGIADRAANSTFTASHRQIAVESGLSRRASTATTRCVALGWSGQERLEDSPRSRPRAWSGSQPVGDSAQHPPLDGLPQPSQACRAPPRDS